jgi:Glycosyl transferase family 2
MPSRVARPAGAGAPRIVGSDVLSVDTSVEWVNGTRVVSSGLGDDGGRPMRGSRRSASRSARRAAIGPVLTALPGAQIDLTVVVPFYNPGGEVVRSTVERAVEVLRATGASFEVIAVSDGCTDGSEATLEDLDPDVVTCVRLSERGGKGQAVRAGLVRGRGRYLGFIDGDGDVPPEILAEFLQIARDEDPDIVLGSKRHPDSEVVYPLARRLYSWGYQQLVALLFNLDVRDTQAGVKLVRRDVLAKVLPDMCEDGYAFDLELLVLANRAGFHHHREAPVRIGKRFSSTVSSRVVAEMLVDTFAIWWRLHSAGRERRAGGPIRAKGTDRPSDQALSAGGEERSSVVTMPPRRIAP